MKNKILSALLAAVLAFSTIPAYAGANGEAADKHFMLTYQNFELNGSSVTTEDDTTTLTGVDKKILIKGAKTSNFVTASIYSDKECTCSVWALLQYTAAARFPEAYVNDTEITTEFAWNTTGYSDWFKLENASLKKGWNEIKFAMQADWNNYYLRAVYITTEDGDAIDLSSDEAKLAQYGDSVAPVISDEDAEKSFSENTLHMKFPAATDNSGTVYYKYSVNNVTKNIEDISSFVEIGEIYGDTEVSFTALDAHGNKAEKTFSVSAPKFELNSDGFLFTYKNFAAVPTYAGGGLVDKADGNWTDDAKTADKSIKLAGGDTSLFVTANFYVEKEDDYALWILSATYGANKAERHVAAYIDSTADTSSFNTTNALSWNKGAGADDSGKYHLTEGWHTLKVGLSGAWYTSILNAAYITNDLAFAMSDAALKEIAKKQYDTEKPTLKTALSAAFTSAEKCTLTMPTFDDESTVAETKLYVNGTEKPFSTTLSLEGLKPLEEVKIKAEATDKFGNKTEYETVYISSPVQAAGFAPKKGTVEVSDISALSAGDTLSVDAKLTNATASTKKAVLYICVLTDGGKRMTLCSPKKAVTLASGDADVAVNASITLPTDFNAADTVIQATLWDEDTNEPFITAVEIKEAG